MCMCTSTRYSSTDVVQNNNNNHIYFTLLFPGTPSSLCNNQPVVINHPMMLVSGAGASLNIFTFFLEDCCKVKRFPWVSNTTFWNGYLAGPQGLNYRHLKIKDEAGPISFYHMNCEHGTGSAICEIHSSHNINIYGFKTEGNTVALDIVNSSQVQLYGTGGCGCVPNSSTTNVSLYQIREGSTNILMANVVGQGSHYSSSFENPFGEAGCDPSRETRIMWENGVTTPVLDRPVVFVVSSATKSSGSSVVVEEEETLQQ